MSNENQRSNLETNAAVRKTWPADAIDFARNLERQRDEARELLYQITGQMRKKDKTLPKPAEVLDWMADKTRKIEALSKRAEAIRCELVEKDKQLAATQLYLDEARKELEAMRDAIKEAHDALPATLNRAFVRGWMRGHEHTVEGTFIPILAQDEATFFEIDEELIEDGSLPELQAALAKLQPFLP